MALIAGRRRSRSRCESRRHAPGTALASLGIATASGAGRQPRSSCRCCRATRHGRTSTSRARARSPLLDEFDARGAAGRRSSTRRCGSCPPRRRRRTRRSSVEPGLRTEPQPIRVLHNGRFSLPAGRYRIEVDWNGDAARRNDRPADRPHRRPVAVVAGRTAARRTLDHRVPLPSTSPSLVCAARPSSSASIRPDCDRPHRRSIDRDPPTAGARSARARRVPGGDSVFYLRQQRLSRGRASGFAARARPRVTIQRERRRRAADAATCTAGRSPTACRSSTSGWRRPSRCSAQLPDRSRCRQAIARSSRWTCQRTRRSSRASSTRRRAIHVRWASGSR